MKKRSSVTNMSSESNLLMFRLKCFSRHQSENVQSKRRQVIFQAQVTFSSFMQKPTEKPLVMLACNLFKFCFAQICNLKNYAIKQTMYKCQRGRHLN